MPAFKPLTKKQIEQIEKLIELANSSLQTSAPIIINNAVTRAFLGTVIGGTVGTALMTGAGSIVAGFCGLGIVSTLALPLALPVTVITIITAGIGLTFGKKKEDKEEQLKQANYCRDLAKKQQELYKKYEKLKKEHEKTSKEKDDIIRKQQEKLAEYEALFEAIKKIRGGLEKNLALV